MKNTKNIVTVFAIFAATLMLMTTCIAEPTLEITTKDFLEDEKNQLSKSIYALQEKVLSDDEYIYLSEDLSNNNELNKILYDIDNAESDLEKSELIINYNIAFCTSSEYIEIIGYLGDEYCSDFKNIISETKELMNVEDTNSNDDYYIVGYLPLSGAIYSAEPSISYLQYPNMQTVESVNGMEYQDWYIPNDDNSEYDQVEDSLESHFVSFLHDGNGNIYIPGLGWVSEEEWGWLETELAGLKIKQVLYILLILNTVLMLCSGWGTPAYWFFFYAGKDLIAFMEMLGMFVPLWIKSLYILP